MYKYVHLLIWQEFFFVLVFWLGLVLSFGIRLVLSTIRFLSRFALQLVLTDLQISNQRVTFSIRTVFIYLLMLLYFCVIKSDPKLG